MNPNPIYDITPFSALDFPDHLAAIVWFAGCNMRCAYCHNGHIATAKGRIGLVELEAFLKSRRGLLDGIVLSGGEPTIHSNLSEFAELTRNMGFKIKLDTNGTNPEPLKKMLDAHLLDYIALDLKATKEKYEEVTGMDAYDHVHETLKMIRDSGVAYEVRTTYHSQILTPEEVASLKDSLPSDTRYFVQNYRESGRELELLGPSKKIDAEQLSDNAVKIR